MRYAFSLFIGLLYPLTFSPFGDKLSLVAYLIIPLIALLFHQLLLSENKRQGFLYAYLFGVGLFSSGVSWVYVAINEFGNTVWWLAAILSGLFILVLALFYGAFGLCSFLVLKNRTNIKDKAKALLLFFPPLWVFFEWLRSWLFTGFPWLFSGYSQTDTLFSGLAPIVGVYGISFIIVLLSSYLLLFKHLQSIYTVRVLSITLCIVLLSLAVKDLSWSAAKPKSAIRVAMVQGNISQHQRWQKGYLYHVINSYLRLSRALWGQHDLIVWPENAIPDFYHRQEKFLYQPLQQKLQNHYLLTGLPVQEEDGRYYNAMLLLGNQQQQFYYKQHLVPFGEYLPFEQLLRGLIDFFNIPMSGFSSPQQQSPIFNIGRDPVLVNICYEDAFPQLFSNHKFAYMINLSNNSWYGDSYAPHQHLQIARMRALEYQRELIRSTTGGITALIDAFGHIKQQGAQFEQLVVTGKISPRSGQTPFAKLGIVALCLMMIGFILLNYIIFILSSEKSDSAHRIKTID